MAAIKKRGINSQWEDQMVSMVEAATTYKVEREFRFHQTRRWRFDCAIPELMVALEMEGGVWSGGRHVNPLGFEKDLEKYNTATMMGWAVYRLVPRMLNQGWIEKIFDKEKPND